MVQKSRLYSDYFRWRCSSIVWSGLWKPVQFSLLTILFGGYDTARYIHFLCMNIMVLFIIIHTGYGVIGSVHCYL